MTWKQEVLVLFDNVDLENSKLNKIYCVVFHVNGVRFEETSLNINQVCHEYTLLLYFCV